MSIKKLRIIGPGGAPAGVPGATTCGLWRSCRGSLLCLLLAALPLATGCAARRPPAAADNLRLTEIEQRQRPVMSEAQQREVLAAMKSVAKGHEPRSWPSSGLRFSDVPLAAAVACGRAQAAIIATMESEDEVVFELRTVEDWPGELRVWRVEGAGVYEASAWFGRFPQMPERRERAQDLLRAFDEEMEAFGRKRR